MIEPIPSRGRGKKDPFSSKRAYSGHSYVHPLILLVKFLPSNQRAVDSITGDSGHPNYERVPSFKDLLDIIYLQRPVLLGGISLHRKKKSWLSLRLVSPKRQSQSKELANWHTSLNQSKAESRQAGKV